MHRVIIVTNRSPFRVYCLPDGELLSAPSDKRPDQWCTNLGRPPDKQVATAPSSRVMRPKNRGGDRDRKQRGPTGVVAQDA